ncbi:hypothetical protein SNEBB_010823 [Seison nebaliae]|nr:hypothetical protein SNEBB_010823 [Seison nebaliae]
MNRSEVAKKCLVQSFLTYLKKEADGWTGEAIQKKEGMEIVCECLESAFLHETTSIQVKDVDLLDLVEKNMKLNENIPSNNMERAEELKLEGNQLIKEGRLMEAIGKYDEAIKLNPTSAIFYYNRSVAHARNGDEIKAIDDAKESLCLNPLYAKAYARLGASCFNLNRFSEAIDAYTKACELDPMNESYKSNLTLSQQNNAQQQQQQFPNNAGAPDGGATPNVPDLSQILNNDNIINMAATMLQDQNMQSAMTNLMTSFTQNHNQQQQQQQQQQPPPPQQQQQQQQQPEGLNNNNTENAGNVNGSNTNASNEQSTSDPMSQFFAAGRTMMQQLYQTNPELINDFHNIFRPSNQNGSSPNNNNNNDANNNNNNNNDDNNNNGPNYFS